MLALDENALALIGAEIARLDPDGSIVKLDLQAKTVLYSNNFVLHEALSGFQGEEEVVRAYILVWLCTTAGYLPQNIELEKRYSIGRPKEGAELDILLKRPTGEPYALIEVKAPDEYETDQDKYIEGQLFNIAPHEPGATVLSYATIQVANETVQIHAVTIDFKEYSTWEKWKAARAAGNNIPINYGEPLHVHFEKGGEKDLKRNLKAAYFQTLRKRLHDILWKGSTPDNVIYHYVVRLFLAKIFDEKNTREGERYKFQLDGYPVDSPGPHI